jgi:hypothetical protein
VLVAAAPAWSVVGPIDVASRTHTAVRISVVVPTTILAARAENSLTAVHRRFHNVAARIVVRRIASAAMGFVADSLGTVRVPAFAVLWTATTTMSA